MRAKWGKSAEATIKIPSIQTILFVLLLAGSMIAIICVAIAVRNEAPEPPSAPTAMPVEGPAAWLTAWSTFSGAVAGSVAAVGTTGALWLGVVVYRRQEQDQRRAQAKAITVTQVEGTGALEGAHGTITRLTTMPDVTAGIRNDSPYPIYAIALIIRDNLGRSQHQELRSSVPPHDKFTYTYSSPVGSTVYAEFDDSAGIRWRRYFNGDLEELRSRSRRVDGTDHEQVSQASAEVGFEQ